MRKKMDSLGLPWQSEEKSGNLLLAATHKATWNKYSCRRKAADKRSTPCYSHSLLPIVFLSFLVCSSCESVTHPSFFTPSLWQEPGIIPLVVQGTVFAKARSTDRILKCLIRAPNLCISQQLEYFSYDNKSENMCFSLMMYVIMNFSEVILWRRIEILNYSKETLTNMAMHLGTD